MGEEIATSEFRAEDFAQYRARLLRETELLAQAAAHGRFPACDTVAGFELECCLTDARGRPAPVNDELLARIGSPSVVPELARFDIEINSEPHTLYANALARLHQELCVTFARCKEHARPLGIEPVLIGILPTLTEDDLTLAQMSPSRRFRALNDQVFRRRHGRPIPLDIHGREHLHTEHCDVMLEAAATSFQLHLQVPPQRAVALYNAAIALSAPMVAVSANSPYLFGRDLWAETRIPLFEQAVDTGEGREAARVTFGSGYATETLLEVFRENAQRYPVLLPVVKDDTDGELAHVRLHNGTIWRWNRPLIGSNDAGELHWRIEHRVMPAGPSTIDAIANAAFFFGLAQYYSAPGFTDWRPSFDRARTNFYRAARLGLDAGLAWRGDREVATTTLVREELLPAARAGLRALGVYTEDIESYLRLIDDRVRSGQNGSVWQRRYVGRHGPDMEQLTCAYRERQRSGAPVHEWAL